MKNTIGMIGLSVMGRSLALNMADHGYQVAGYNRSYAVTKHMIESWPHENFTPYETLQAFVNSLEKPRKVMLMVKAGASVDSVIDQLCELLDAGDIILDGGNSFFKDTIRRAAYVKAKGFHYFGVGVSGGEDGARHGPSIMPGGDQTTYAYIKPILESIAAKAEDGEACCAYIGENGAGHYVKMVHNGIEYADMQIISEAYLLMKYVANMDNVEIADAFKTFQESELDSFLIKITGDILVEKDPQKAGHLIDQIKDTSSHKGTGKWTSEESIQLGVDVSMIVSSFMARVMSNNENHATCQKLYPLQSIHTVEEKSKFIQQVKEGMYAAKIIAYAQGFDLLKQAAKQYDWQLHFDQIAAIFRAGCIIQARFLTEIRAAYQENPNLSHILLHPFFKHQIEKDQASLRKLVTQAVQNGIAVPSLSSALTYFDQLRSKHLGANLIQAQRDYFGAHTFERIDQEGSVHHEWNRSSE